MKLKLLTFLVVLVATMAALPGRSYATTKELRFAVNGCSLRLVHGNAFGGALAKITAGAGSSMDQDCLLSTGVRLKYKQNGVSKSKWCYLNSLPRDGCSLDYIYGWTQAFFLYTSFEGPTRVRICAAGHPCVLHDFAW